MKKNNKNIGTGTEFGMVFGLFSAMLFNKPLLILICLAIGMGYDKIKNKRK